MRKFKNDPTIVLAALAIVFVASATATFIGAKYIHQLVGAAAGVQAANDQLRIAKSIAIAVQCEGRYTDQLQQRMYCECITTLVGSKTAGYTQSLGTQSQKDITGQCSAIMDEWTVISASPATSKL